MNKLFSDPYQMHESVAMIFQVYKAQRVKVVILAKHEKINMAIAAMIGVLFSCVKSTFGSLIPNRY
jgi:hypothetical protein